MSALSQLKAQGQSFWLDSLSRDIIDDGNLSFRIREQGLSGITSNPAIFAGAMADSESYDARIQVVQDAAADVEEVYRALAVADVRDACDLLLPLYRHSDQEDGYVSLEVSPHLAFDPVATIRQARELWAVVARPNLMIKVPGTRPGLHATEILLFEGVNVNVTLLFGVDDYREVQQVYLRALEKRLNEGRDLSCVRSVASFFLSRIDVAVDVELRQRIHHDVAENLRQEAQSLLGKTAVANAKLAYVALCELLASERWQELERRGARPQRLVWASTGTKDPSYSDVMYVEPLIGPQTVSTMPEDTANAFADHGQVAETLTKDRSEAEDIMDRLVRLGIDLTVITAHLVSEGVQKFIDPYDALLESLKYRVRL